MRRRILLLVVGMTTLALVAFSIPMLLLIRSTVGQQAQNSTQEQARNIALYLRAGSFTTSKLTLYVAQQHSDSGRPVSITLPSGAHIGSTPVDSTTPRNAPRGGYFNGGYPSTSPATGGSTGSAGNTVGSGGSPGGDSPGNGAGGGGDPFRAQSQLQPAPGGEVAVTFAQSASGDPYLVRVYLADSARYSGVGTQYLLLLGAAAILIILGAVAGELLTRRIARPLVETAATAQRLSHGDTTARAPTDGPTEVADVGRALNRLADRIDELIAEERETVADLSHRLRTPLTALRLDAEALHDPADAERVGSHVSSLERMLTAVIHAARRPQREGRIPSCDATDVVHERVRFWSALTEEQGRTATISLPAEPMLIRAGAEDLAAAVDALLENVVAHTPEGVAFAVRLRTEDGLAASLTISDDGPGLPAETPVRGRSDRGSTGLGLDIARRCAEASGGSMTLGASPSGGAMVTLHLGGP